LQNFFEIKQKIVSCYHTFTVSRHLPNLEREIICLYIFFK